MKFIPFHSSECPTAVYDDLVALGVRFNWADLSPEFVYDPDTHTLRMWVAKLNVWDSGRIVVGLPEFLRLPGYERAYGKVLGHAEDLWRGRSVPTTTSGWARLRKTAKRGQGRFTSQMYVSDVGNEAAEAVKAAVAPLYHETARKRLLSEIEHQPEVPISSV